MVTYTIQKRGYRNADIFDKKMYMSDFIDNLAALLASPYDL